MLSNSYHIIHTAHSTNKIEKFSLLLQKIMSPQRNQAQYIDYNLMELTFERSLLSSGRAERELWTCAFLDYWTSAVRFNALWLIVADQQHLILAATFWKWWWIHIFNFSSQTQRKDCIWTKTFSHLQHWMWIVALISRNISTFLSKNLYFYWKYSFWTEIFCRFQMSSIM